MELSTVPYYSKCWFKNHQVKAVLGVGAFLSLSTIIFCSYCSHARSHLCDVMKWGMDRGKRKVSHLKCTCHSPFPSPSAWPWNSPLQNPSLSKGVHENQSRALRSPAPQHRACTISEYRLEDLRTKRLEWRHCLMGGVGEESLWMTCFLVKRKFSWEYALLGEDPASPLQAQLWFWMAAHLGLSLGSWELKCHAGSNADQGLPRDSPTADCPT